MSVQRKTGQRRAEYRWIKRLTCALNVRKHTNWNCLWQGQMRSPKRLAVCVFVWVRMWASWMNQQAERKTVCIRLCMNSWVFLIERENECVRVCVFSCVDQCAEVSKLCFSRLTNLWPNIKWFLYLFSSVCSQSNGPSVTLPLSLTALYEKYTTGQLFMTPYITLSSSANNTHKHTHTHKPLCIQYRFITKGSIRHKINSGK